MLLLLLLQRRRLLLLAHEIKGCLLLHLWWGRRERGLHRFWHFVGRAHGRRARVSGVLLAAALATLDEDLLRHCWDLKRHTALNTRVREELWGRLRQLRPRRYGVLLLSAECTLNEYAIGNCGHLRVRTREAQRRCVDPRHACSVA